VPAFAVDRPHSRVLYLQKNGSGKGGGTMQKYQLINSSRSQLTFSSVLLGMIVILMLVHTSPAKAAEKIRTPVDLSTAIVQVAKRNIPAVVHIEVTGQQEVAAPREYRVCEG
jgi:hypothetical protein